MSRQPRLELDEVSHITLAEMLTAIAPKSERESLGTPGLRPNTNSDLPLESVGSLALGVHSLDG